MMAFRVGGALESLQEQYFLLNLCFSMVTFDLQAQVRVQTALQECDKAGDNIVCFAPLQVFTFHKVLFGTVY